MIRGRKALAVAVRDPRGRIVVHKEPLRGGIYSSAWARVFFLRGLIRLWDALVLGTRTLFFSANVALSDDEGEEELGGPWLWGTLLAAISFVVVFFFLIPLLLARLLDPYLPYAWASNLVEGVIRLAFLLLYLVAIGRIPYIERVFAYHGAEHKVINAYEAREPVEPGRVRLQSTTHLRCGTAFLLWVVLLSVFVFSLLGHPPLLWRIASRILLIPLLAGLSYEVLRFGATHHRHPLVRFLIAPSLALQGLTTRQPDDAMLEVAIAAFKAALSADQESV